MESKTIKKYFAKYDKPFDKGSEVELIKGYIRTKSQIGYFRGTKTDGNLKFMVGELCDFDCFEIRSKTIIVFW